MTQATEGHLELPDVQHIVVPEVPVRPLTGHPQGGTILADTAYADAVGVVAVVAEGRDAVGADPVVAAVVLAALLLEPLPEHPFDLLLGAVEHLFGHVVPGEPFVEHLGVVEPVEQLLSDLRADLTGGSMDFGVVEVFGKGLLEPVVVGLRLAQGGQSQLIEAVHGRIVEAVVETFQEGQPLVGGDIQAVGAQQIKERGKHRQNLKK